MGSAPRPPRVLYLAFFFPPSRASGVYRARATANHLADHGWDVTVFGGPEDFFQDVTGVDAELERTVDSRIRVCRPGLGRGPWEHDIRRFSAFRRAAPVLTSSFHQWALRRLFPERYWSWGAACVGRALRQHLVRPFDVVVATGNPFVSFAAAWLVHRLTGVPFVVDYRDAWTLNMFTEAPAFPDGHPSWRWERRVMRDAAAAVFVNDALRRWYAERYPAAAGRMAVVPNGWDPDLLSPDEVVVPRPAGPAGPIRFAFVGTLNGMQPVDELVAAFAAARRHPDLADARLNIYGHLGYFSVAADALKVRLGVGPGGAGDAEADAGIVYRGPVPKTEIARVYRENDVLVFLAGGARYVTSGKVFEYMATGSPIVSVHAAGIAAAEVLAGYPLWFTANGLDVEDVAASMIAAGKAARDLTPEQRAAARRHAARYARDASSRMFEARLRAVTAPGASPRKGPQS